VTETVNTGSTVEVIIIPVIATAAAFSLAAVRHRSQVAAGNRAAFAE
jgi:hypothetical protein